MDLLARMETFVRVVEAGSFSAAAKQLRISVAAVSRHVVALEDELGGQLLARSTRRLALTPTGQRYYESCLRVLREVDDAQSVSRRGPSGPVRMSITVSVALLADAFVDSLLAHDRELRIDVRVEDQLVDLALDNVDVAVRVGAPPPSSNEVVALELARWRRIVVASPAYVAAHGAPSEPSALARRDGLSTARGTLTDLWTLDDGTATARVRIAARLTTNAGHLLRRAAIGGRGIALLPDWYVADDIAARRLVRLLPNWASETTTVHALYRSKLRKDARVRSVLERLRKAFGDGSWRTTPSDGKRPSRVPRA